MCKEPPSLQPARPNPPHFPSSAPNPYIAKDKWETKSLPDPGLKAWDLV